MKKYILVPAILLIGASGVSAKDRKDLLDDFKGIKQWSYNYAQLYRKNAQDAKSNYAKYRWRELDRIANVLIENLLKDCGKNAKNLKDIAIADAPKHDPTDFNLKQCEDSIEKAREFRFIVREAEDLVKNPSQTEPPKEPVNSPEKYLVNTNSPGEPFDLSKDYERPQSYSEIEEEILGPQTDWGKKEEPKKEEPKKEEPTITPPTGENK